MQLMYLVIMFVIGIALGLLIMLRIKAQVQHLLNAQIHELKSDATAKQATVMELNANLAIANTEIEYAKTKYLEQKAEIIAMKEQFTLEFENLANRIFEEKANKFSEQNQTNLANLLTPLGNKIKDFEKQVADAYNLEGKERAMLKEQIQTLTKLNQQMSVETQNLTLALKGDSKTQGNWGEMILESILEKSGLVENREYFLQQMQSDAEGKRYQPDVIIKLPQDKVIIIDAKVSLTAYERFVSGVDAVTRELALKEHIQSLESHIKNLSNKSYHSLYQIKSLDFVLLFIPIESAFALALQYKSSLFDEALAKNIVLVCPSTLLATMRTVESIWRSEKSAQNANEIAKLGGELHDRLVGFLNSLELVNSSLQVTQNKYNDALTKLSGNRGVIKSALRLKELGAKTSKTLENKWIDE